MGAGRDASAGGARAARRASSACNARSKPRHVAYKETIRRSGAGARPAQEAVGRSRPVRRCGGRDQAAAARRGLRVHRHDHRRRGAEAVYPGGRGWRFATGWTTARSASRWSTSSVNLSDGSYHDVDSSEMAFKTAARIAMTEGMPQCSAGAARADRRMSTSMCRPRRRRASTRSSPAAAASCWASMPATAGRAGTRSRRIMPESGDRHAHHRAALGDRRRRHLQLPPRSHGGADRPPGGAGHGGAQGRSRLNGAVLLLPRGWQICHCRSPRRLDCHAKPWRP